MVLVDPNGSSFIAHDSQIQGEVSAEHDQSEEDVGLVEEQKLESSNEATSCQVPRVTLTEASDSAHELYLYEEQSEPT